MEDTNPIFRFIRKNREAASSSGIPNKRIKRDNGGLDEHSRYSSVSNRLSLHEFLGKLTANNLKQTILHDIIPLGTNTSLARKNGIKARNAEDERIICNEQAEYWMRHFREKLKETQGKDMINLIYMIYMFLLYRLFINFIISLQMNQAEDINSSEQSTTTRTDINTFTPFMTADMQVASANALSCLESLLSDENQSELDLHSKCSQKIGKLCQYIYTYDPKTKYKTKSCTWPIQDPSASMLVQIRMMDMKKATEILTKEDSKPSYIYASRIRDYQVVISDKEDEMTAVYLFQLLKRIQIQTNIEVNPNVKLEELKPRYARF